MKQKRLSFELKLTAGSGNHTGTLKIENRETRQVSLTQDDLVAILAATPRNVAKLGRFTVVQSDTCDSNGGLTITGLGVQGNIQRQPRRTPQWMQVQADHGGLDEGPIHRSRPRRMRPAYVS